MNRGDLGFGLVIAVAIGSGVAVLAGIVYVIITVAKWAWGS